MNRGKLKLKAKSTKGNESKIKTKNKNRHKKGTFKVEYFAMLFLVFGIIVLYFMSLASKPVYVSDYSELGKYEGKNVIIKGIVIDYDTTSYGEVILTVLEPDDLESTLKIFIESSGTEYSIGDIIQAKGSVLRLSEDFLELVVVNEKDIEKIGHWQNLRLSIPELAHRLEHHSAEFRNLPVEVSGYLKYEPRNPVTSLRLTEHPTDGFYTVKVEVPNSAGYLPELHKGDLISLNVTIVYNENNFEYKLILKNITLLEPYGDWVVELSELSAAPFVFEGATINTSGYIYKYEPNYNYILLLDTPSELRSESNSSIWVDISGLNLSGKILQDDYFIGISGVLYYDPQYIDYAIRADEIFIDN